MESIIHQFSEMMGKPISFVSLSAVGILASGAGFIFDLGETYSFLVNLSISLLTMIIGQAVLVSSQRDGIAIHLKLDRLIEAAPADNDAIGTEHEKAEKLEAQRHAVEKRTGNAL